MVDKTKPLILNVDDKEASRYVTSRILHKAGYRVIEAASGQETLNLLQQRPDLIILDINLPDINGFEVCRRLKDDPHYHFIPVLMVSAIHKSSLDIVEGLKAGAEGYLIQPIESIVLIAYVKALLRMSAAETDLLKANRQWLNTFNAINDCIFIQDKEGRITNCNRATLDFLDQTFSQIKGASCRGLFQCEESPGFECPLSLMSKSSSRAKTEKLIKGRWFICTIDPILDQNKKFIGSIHIMEDITGRKQIEEKLRASEIRYAKIINQSVDAIISADSEMNITIWNPAAEKIFGFRAEEMLGRSLLKIVPKRFHEAKKKGFGVFAKTGQGQVIGKTLELWGLRKDGQEIQIELSVSSREENGVFVPTGIVRDITDRKKAEQEIQKAMTMKEEFTSMVSHELRTPLTAIKEGISLVLEEIVGAINPQQKTLLGTANKSVDRLARLINDVLDLQKLAGGLMTFYIKENSLNEIIMEIYESMLPVASEKGLELRLQLDEGLPPIKFDKDKIIQVIINLVNNALKFTEKGNIIITTRQQDNQALVTVSDTGLGIKKDDLPKLFLSFQQVGGEKSRKAGGTGLGLAICKKIVTQHGGSIWVESKVGQGSVFYFTLPK